jgi:hypothetical protein
MSPTQDGFYHSCFSFGCFEDAHDDHDDFFQTVRNDRMEFQLLTLDSALFELHPLQGQKPNKRMEDICQ